MMNNRITVFDTTLRDGQQSPGCGMSFEANIEYAHLAHQLGIDVLEAGFPSASQLDFDIVKTIASELQQMNSRMRIAGLCQLREAQVIKTMEALAPYQDNATLHVYLPVDPNLMHASLGERAQDKAGLLKDVASMIELAATSGFKVQFSPEGYSNMGDTFDFVTDVIRTAIDSGASVINCPDTIGGACEWQAQHYIVANMNRHAEIFAKEFPHKDITWSIHCHNDFGLALANTMNAVFKGPARQIEGCINGVGERAGNTALEQCILYIKQFGPLANKEHPLHTNCDATKLQAISNFVSQHMMARQANWPIVGLNAARHSSGGHTNAVLRNPLAYQPFLPEEVGSQISLIFGPLSGGNHAKAIIEAAGFECSDAEKAHIAQHIKDLFQERRKGVTDEEVIHGYKDYLQKKSVENNMPAKNIIEKIWDAHVVCDEVGYPTVFSIDFMLMHEVTSAQAFSMIEERGYPVKYPERILATIDHSIPTSKNRLVIVDEQARQQVDLLRDNAKKYGITLYDFDSHHQGIVHVVGPELGATQPGMTIVCGDSHTATHGAFGALAFGIGTSEVAHVLATGCLLQHKPKTMRVEFTGSFAPGVTSKDAIMKLIAQIGIGGAVGYIIEYTGPAIRTMSMEARMTLCNMSIECGARAGLIGPDETTFAYLKGRQYAPQGREWDEAVQRWQLLCSDADCHYDASVSVDLNTLKPMVTWGINPEQAIGIDECTPRYETLSDSHQRVAQKAYEYTQLSPGQKIAGTAIQWAFIGSCTNGRIEDLRAAASVMRGKHIAEGVTMYVVPGSEQVLAQARQEGLDKIFEQAGADFRMPGCSMCLAMNDDKVPPGARCISTSNRNFIGRQGTGSITHLASPYTVAASALAGKICCVADLKDA